MYKFDIKDLNLYYGDFHALHGINIGIKPNEITAFIGPSGCGKSTLLKSLNRMNDMVEGCRIEGDVLLDGEDIYGDMDVNHLRKRVGMVFQKPNPFPMSIYDNIAYGPRTHGIKNKAELDEIVERSLRSAAIWDEVKDRLKNPHSVFPVGNNNVFVWRVLWQSIRKYYSWMNQPVRWTQFLLLKLKTWFLNLKRIIPS